ncbi:MAG: hypothetical protein LPH21_01855 [Shewanella sp.]|nr:hypothetical protein [Shewanella sp.]MCF1456347.1 hypothetical protein [Shewanella sp.]
MKGWLMLGLIAAGIYYLYNNTSILDEQKTEGQKQFQAMEQKVKTIASTQITRVDNQLDDIRANFRKRMNEAELAELELITSSRKTISDFKDNFCTASVPVHPVFSTENTRALCDLLPD